MLLLSGAALVLLQAQTQNGMPQYFYFTLAVETRPEWMQSATSLVLDATHESKGGGPHGGLRIVEVDGVAVPLSDMRAPVQPVSASQCSGDCSSSDDAYSDDEQRASRSGSGVTLESMPPTAYDAPVELTTMDSAAVDAAAQDVGTGVATAPQLDRRDSRGRCVVLRLFGMGHPSHTTIAILRTRLEKHLTGMTLAYLCLLLTMNRLFKLSPSDVQFVKPRVRSADGVGAWVLPPGVVNVGLFMRMMHQSLMGAFNPLYLSQGASTPDSGHGTATPLACRMGFVFNSNASATKDLVCALSVAVGSGIAIAMVTKLRMPIGFASGAGGAASSKRSWMLQALPLAASTFLSKHMDMDATGALPVPEALQRVLYGGPAEFTASDGT